VFPRAAESRAAFTLLQALFHTARTRGNEGRLSEAWETLDQALRLTEQIGDRHWRPRIANTRGWILQELLDPEPARRLNTGAVRLALELGDVEAECNAHINAARDFLTVGNPQQAWEHLRRGVARYEEDTWYRWIYYPRLQAEMASYWICRGDLVEASSCVHSSLEHAERTTSRKRMAWAHKLLGDIAMLENRPGHARREFDVALQILEGHACPTIEWRILGAASVAASAERDDAARDQALAHARFTVQKLADSIWDHTLRQKFLHSKPIRELGPWSG
jgi:tetratricopeptide (TPR) repeat protein